MTRFDHKRILIGITGGIAAYKACEVIRMLQREGAAQVLALMTPEATQFITPLTLESLTRHPVYTTHLENTPDGIPTHVWLAQQMDAFLMVPASANTLGKLAHGLGDNLLTTTALTFTDKPLVIAPAMNTRMWENPLVQHNVKHLEKVPFITIVPPQVGDLACGEHGDGKLASPERILAYLAQALHPHRTLFYGKTVLITAGGTAEPIDAVRTLTNRSSGKMGIALADELFAMGATVCLVHTLPTLDKPYPTVFVETARDMQTAVQQYVDTADIVLMAAAVADFKAPDHLANHKVKKQDTWTLTLEKNPDILQSLGAGKKTGQLIVGFAAESEHVMDYAQEKLVQKHLDMIVANDISRPDIGFGSEDNEVTLLCHNEAPVRLQKASKQLIARQILLHLYQRFLAPREGAVCLS